MPRCPQTDCPTNMWICPGAHRLPTCGYAQVPTDYHHVDLPRCPQTTVLWICPGAHRQPTCGYAQVPTDHHRVDLPRYPQTTNMWICPGAHRPPTCGYAQVPTDHHRVDLPRYPQITNMCICPGAHRPPTCESAQVPTDHRCVDLPRCPQTTIMWICPGAQRPATNYWQEMKASWAAYAEAQITPYCCESKKELPLRQLNRWEGLIAVASNSPKGQTSTLDKRAWEGSYSRGEVPKFSHLAVLTWLHFGILGCGKRPLTENFIQIVNVSMCHLEQRFFRDEWGSHASIIVESTAKEEVH